MESFILVNKKRRLTKSSLDEFNINLDIAFFDKSSIMVVPDFNKTTILIKNRNAVTSCKSGF